MTDLLYGDEDALRLRRQSFVLSEFLSQQGYEPPRMDGRALVHGHCHHKSVLGWESELDLLRRTGLNLAAPESGCCGMAGAFGYEEERRDVSVACGERVLLPAVREAAGETLIVADGFSCREQILQLTDRRALHLAQVLELATRGALEKDVRSLERELAEVPTERGVPVGVLAGAGLALGVAAYLWTRNGRS